MKKRRNKSRSRVDKTPSPAPEPNGGMPINTFFGTVYLAKAEKLPPPPAERKPSPGMCVRCMRKPVAAGNHRLCYLCASTGTADPFMEAASLAGTRAVI